MERRKYRSASRCFNFVDHEQGFAARSRGRLPKVPESDENRFDLELATPRKREKRDEDQDDDHRRVDDSRTDLLTGGDDHVEDGPRFGRPPSWRAMAETDKPCR